ncbi:ANTAR domain-containing protein [Cellulomonas sp. Marseille-Q8402]
MTDVCAVWPGAEPARSVLALLDDLVEIVGRRTGSVVEGTVHARRRGADWLITTTGERAARCDAAPPGNRPWRAALDSSAAVLLPDLRDARNGWEPWRRATLDEGFRCVAALPAPLARGGVTALSLYLDDPGACGPEVVRRATGFVGEMASLIELHSSIPVREPAAPAERRRQARASVDHAVGVLMEIRGCDEDEARHVLEVLGSARGRTTEAVAAQVVQHAVRVPSGSPVTRRD